MFQKFNSIEYNIILDVFKEYQIDHWLACIIEEYIYEMVTFSNVVETVSSSFSLVKPYSKVSFRTRFGEKDGECKKWAKNGLLEEESFYQQGNLHGEYKTYYTDYCLTCGTFLNDNLRCLVCMTYAQSKLHQHMCFDSGNLVGEAKVYYMSGKLLRITTYSKQRLRIGEYDNEYTEYYEDGKLKEKYSYINNNTSKYQKWDSKGQLIEESLYYSDNIIKI